MAWMGQHCSTTREARTADGIGSSGSGTHTELSYETAVKIQTNRQRRDTLLAPDGADFMSGDLQSILPYLRFGEITRIGRGAVSGSGRFLLQL